MCQLFSLKPHILPFLLLGTGGDTRKDIITIMTLNTKGTVLSVSNYVKNGEIGRIIYILFCRLLYFYYLCGKI